MAIEKKKWAEMTRKEKTLGIVGLAIVLLIVVSVISAGNKTTKTASNTESINKSSQSGTTQSSTSSNTKKEAALPKIGEATRDGKFEFVVKKVECGKGEIVSPDSDYLRKSAQGQYCSLSISVKNIGNEQQGFFSSNQKLLDASKKTYGSDDTATSYSVPTSQETTWTQINPGNSVDASVVFDIPKDVKPSTAELHDSAFSGGTKVSLQ